MALVADTDELDDDDRVVLMTLHSAKGLEFPIVFLIGLEEGVFPHVRALTEPDELEEERRLAYVGITRAREVLHLSHAWSRNLFGSTQYNPPSRFLDEIPSALVRQEGNVGPQQLRPPVAAPAVRVGFAAERAPSVPAAVGGQQLRPRRRRRTRRPSRARGRRSPRRGAAQHAATGEQPGPRAAGSATTSSTPASARGSSSRSAARETRPRPPCGSVTRGTKHLALAWAPLTKL